MRLIACIFLALLATSFANQALLKGLAKINKDPTGAAILSAISLNLKAKTPLSDVGDLLDGILNDHLAQAQDFEAATADKVEDLNNRIDAGQTLNGNLQNVIQTIQSTIDNAQQSLTDAQAALVSTQQDLSNQQQTLADNSDQAEAELPQLDADIQDFAAAITATQDAISKMNTYQQLQENSASFIQMGTSVKDKIKKVTDTIYGMKKKLAKHSNMFTPLTRELIDLSASLSQSKSEQVIDLLNQLLNALVDGKTSTENQRATDAAHFQEVEDAANAAVLADQDQVDQLTTAIAGLNDKISQSQQFLQQNQDALSDNTAILTANQQNLSDVQDDYAVRSQKFNNLIALIRQAITYFNQNLAEVDDYVAGVVNSL